MEAFYRHRFGGTALEGSRLRELLQRAEDKLRFFERCYTVTGSQTARRLALCAMAEAMGYYEDARAGQGGMRYASVGTVSVSGKGVYGQVDVSPEAEARELYRCAQTYLSICRGAG